MKGIGFGVAAALLAAAPASAATYPTNPYSTVGGPLPTLYCRSAMDASAASPAAASFQAIDLETVGCVSGSGPTAYPDVAGHTNTDGLYGNSGGGDSEDRVEQSILLATGEVVELELYRESGSGASSGGGIQVWVENGGKEIRWAFEQSLVSLIESGTIDIGYLTIKAATGYVLYEIPTGTYSGRYSTEGLMTNGGQQPAVSHVRFWKEIDFATVAEPQTLALLAFGLLVLGLRRRPPVLTRRRQDPIRPVARPLPVDGTSG